MNPITFEPIGTVYTPFKQPAGTPIQPGAAGDTVGRVELLPQYAEGLTSLDGFSHVVLICYLHLARPYTLKVRPFLDDQEHGLFATRAPSRPNSIGLSVAALDRIEGATLHIRGMDVVDGTPLLDLKPYVPAFDAPTEVRIGWLADKIDRLDEIRDDGRFFEQARGIR